MENNSTNHFIFILQNLSSKIFEIVILNKNLFFHKLYMLCLKEENPDKCHTLMKYNTLSTSR